VSASVTVASVLKPSTPAGPSKQRASAESAKYHNIYHSSRTTATGGGVESESDSVEDLNRLLAAEEAASAHADVTPRGVVRIAPPISLVRPPSPTTETIVTGAGRTRFTKGGNSNTLTKKSKPVSAVGNDEVEDVAGKVAIAETWNSKGAEGASIVSASRPPHGKSSGGLMVSSSMKVSKPTEAVLTSPAPTYRGGVEETISAATVGTSEDEGDDVMAGTYYLRREISKHESMKGEEDSEEEEVAGRVHESRDSDEESETGDAVWGADTRYPTEINSKSSATTGAGGDREVSRYTTDMEKRDSEDSLTLATTQDTVSLLPVTNELPTSSSVPLKLATTQAATSRSQSLSSSSRSRSASPEAPLAASASASSLSARLPTTALPATSASSPSATSSGGSETPDSRSLSPSPSPASRRGRLTSQTKFIASEYDTSGSDYVMFLQQPLH
jgi:hypothetical protein